jgi:8-oxo-dGTP pyrophosphatase MutT (NUDIX family)
MSEWIELSKRVFYEGAAAVLCNEKDELMFIISLDKQNQLQAELPGGKVEEQDNGDPIATAIREMEEETGIVLQRNDLIKPGMITLGGTTGTPAYHFLTRPLYNVMPTKLEDKFLGTIWSKLYCQNGKWFTVVNDYPVRKFNTYFLDQNKDSMTRYITHQKDLGYYIVVGVTVGMILFLLAHK